MTLLFYHGSHLVTLERETKCKIDHCDRKINTMMLGEKSAWIGSLGVRYQLTTTARRSSAAYKFNSQSTKNDDTIDPFVVAWNLLAQVTVPLESCSYSSCSSLLTVTVSLDCPTHSTLERST
jgi:hypothetical protein